MITKYAASRLRLEALDLYLWRDVNHIDLKKLWEYLATYLYLPRLRDEKVLLQAVQEGVPELLWQENFAYAEGWDSSRDRYLSLKAGEHVTATLSSQTLLVMPPPSPSPKRFYGSVKLDALRLRRDAGQIADEVIQHFTSLVGAEVEITLEVQVSIPEGVPDNVVRTVTENCRVLKFTLQEFESE